jgi:MFS transporter, AAHS family, 4-hydroxybenzoate transporter
MSTQTGVMNKRQDDELAKWQKISMQKTTAIGLLIVITLLCLIRALDEFATSTGGSLQTSIVNEFFVRGQGLDFAVGLSQFSLIGTAMMPVMILATLYMALADKFGRKLILVISVFGMALGLFISFISTNLVVFLIGKVILTFFIATDIHQIYVMEIAPTDKRALLLSVNSFFGYLAMMLVSVARDASTVNGELIWRNVFVVPAVLGVILTGLLIVFARETKVFLDQRIAFLSKPYEEKAAESAKKTAEKGEAKKEQAGSGGLGKSFKFIFTHRQPRMILFATFFQLLAVMAYFGYYESIMTTSGMTTEQVTQALLVYPITAALFSLPAGYIADKFGRKPATILFAILAFVGLIAFILSAGRQVNPYIIGLIYGVELGCFWNFGGQMGLVFSETVPTEIRATAVAAKGLLSVVVAIISAITISILVGVVNLSTLCLVWGATTVGIAIILFALTVKETRGADLENVVSD